MQFSFDHLVIFSNKPVEAIEPLKKHGIHAVQGGRHETWGTYNTLTYFGLSYIEFLGIEKMDALIHEENRLVTHIVERLPQEKGEGPARIAIRTDDIEGLAVDLKEKGFKVYGPIPGERVRTDGEVIRWSLLFPEIAGSVLELPFFIQWEKPDEVRLAEFKKQRLAGWSGQPNFESVGIVVRDLEETLAVWGGILPLTQSSEFVDEALNARCRIINLPGTELLFCTPVGEGLAAKVLMEKGETPFLVNLTETGRNDTIEIVNGWWRFG